LRRYFPNYGILRISNVFFRFSFFKSIIVAPFGGCGCEFPGALCALLLIQPLVGFRSGLNPLQRALPFTPLSTYASWQSVPTPSGVSKVLDSFRSPAVGGTPRKPSDGYQHFFSTQSEKYGATAPQEPLLSSPRSGPVRPGAFSRMQLASSPHGFSHSLLSECWPCRFAEPETQT
jgi:hypothetical protein